MKKIICISMLSMLCYGNIITNIEGVSQLDKEIEAWKKDFNCEKEIYKKYSLKDPQNDAFDGYIINVTEKPGLTYKALEEGRTFLLDYMNENNEKELAEDLLLNFKGPSDISKLDKYCNEYKEVLTMKKEENKKIDKKEENKKPEQKIEEQKTEKNQNGIILTVLGLMVILGSVAFRFKKRL